MINDDSLALASSTSDRTPQCASAPYSDLRGRIWAEDVHKRIIEDNEAFKKESGVESYVTMGLHYGEGVKDSRN